MDFDSNLHLCASASFLAGAWKKYHLIVSLNVPRLKASALTFKCDVPERRVKVNVGWENSNVFADAEHISWISHCKPAIVCLRVTD